jgi:hypothetical protein
MGRYYSCANCFGLTLTPYMAIIASSGYMRGERMTKYPQFTEQLHSLGNTDQERCNALGVPLRTLTRYKQGRIPSVLLRLAHHPTLVLALVRDLQNQNTTEGGSCDTSSMAA